MIPHLFKKEPIPPITNPHLQKAISEVAQSKTKKQAIQKALDKVLSVSISHRFHTYLVFWKAWEKDPNKLWGKKRFLHCTHQNYLVRVLLVKSGQFKESDIKYGYSLVWYLSPHQHLQIKINNEWFPIDPWYHGCCQKGFGQYASGFGFKQL